MSELNPDVLAKVLGPIGGCSVATTIMVFILLIRSFDK